MALLPILYLLAAFLIGNYFGTIWAIEPGGVPGRLWIGTMPGGLFRSDDGGDSWALNEALWRMPEPGLLPPAIR